jgi:hypothetical protein
MLVRALFVLMSGVTWFGNREATPIASLPVASAPGNVAAAISGAHT